MRKTLNKFAVIFLAVSICALSTHADWKYNPHTHTFDYYQGTAAAPTFLSPLTLNESGAGSDTLIIAHDGTDGSIVWKDGVLKLQTDEGTNTDTIVSLVGKGSGDGSIYFYGGGTTYYSILKQSDAEGLTGTDTRLGLDKNQNRFIICEAEDIDTDFGESTESYPVLVIKSADAASNADFWYGGIYTATNGLTFQSANSTVNLRAQTGVNLTLYADRGYGDFTTINSASGVELIDTDGRQAWIYAEPKVNMNSGGTGAFDGFYLNATLTNVGDGSTGDGNNLLNLAVSDTSLFRIDTTGIPYLKRSGSLGLWSHQEDTLADDGTVNLPDATSGVVFVSCNAEAGMWLVQNDGTVVKISGSTNTAATDSDGDLCVYDGGSTQAIVKNRLGATGEIRIFYFYN